MTYRPGPRDLRASDADRDRVIALLGDAVADGRLTAEEHADRVERAYCARTLGELARLTTDLASPSEQPIRLDGKRPVTGVFGRDVRAGRWVVPNLLPVLAIFGDVELDLREAILQGGRIIVYVTLIAGSLHMIVPAGVVVETSGNAVLTRTKIDRGARPPGRDTGVRPSGGGPGSAAPGSGQTVIELRTVGFGGTIRVTSPRPVRRLGGLRRGSLRGS
ncbi:MAG: DUF1707 and DUF2154 domain-containing protein [Actinobacteria bacterium]|nr:DUF1707 and DUF2154 domain-containing protein [Actinomycetota bacterium]